MYNKVMERLVQVVTCVSCPKEVISYLWAFQMLSKVSALIEMKKVVSCTQDAIFATKVLQQGFTKRDELPAQLLQVRAFQLLKNDKQAAGLLDATQDKNSIAREFINALGLYAQ